nr:hypothetical protein GCM10020092_061180 [Actinoplanes digitatis]
MASDDRDGARQMTGYLRSTGRRRIAIITGPLDTPGGVDRLARLPGDRRRRRPVPGRHRRLHPGVRRGGDDPPAEPGTGPGRRLRLLRPDGGLSAITALQRAGRRVPEDVAVGGFDDNRIATTTTPLLTTIRQPWARQSAEMVRLLLAHIDGAEHAAVILPTELIVRDSA